MTREEGQIIVIIPTYNNAGTLGNVIRDVLSYSLPLLVVNDGSTDNTSGILAGFTSIQTIEYKRNRGKGHALSAGLAASARQGYRYAITMDSDGQHFASDIPVFIREIEKTPDSLLIGARNLTSENMPGKNTFANRFSNFWFRIETGIKLADTQSGFRLYPLKRIEGIRTLTTKYEYELELIVRAAWKGIDVRNIPVNVYYPPREERVSHFRPFRDFTRISILNTVLVILALLWYWPLKCMRSFTRENIRHFISRHITNSGESNLKITLAVMFGVFMGIVPVWGYQMIVAGVLAHFLKLNKVITLVASNISIPPMIPFLLFGSYATGGLVLGHPILLSLHEVTFETLKDSLIQYLVGSMVFAVLCGLLAGLICFPLLSLMRKPRLVHNG